MSEVPDLEVCVQCGLDVPRGSACDSFDAAQCKNNPAPAATTEKTFLGTIDPGADTNTTTVS